MKKSNGTGGALLLTALLLGSLWLWATHHADIQRALCPQPVTAAGHTLSCNGGTVVQNPDGSLAVVTPSPSAVAKRP